MKHHQTSYSLAVLFAAASLVLFGCSSLKPVEVVDVNGPDSLLTGQAGRFSATVGPENATQPVSGAWNFDDGETAEGFEASHTYDQPGDYTVTFTASNRKGDKTSSDLKEMKVAVERPIAAPAIVSLRFDPDTPDTRSEVRFSSVVRQDEREVTGYAWTFSDGGRSSAEQPTHTFAEAGMYEVNLTTSNSAGSDTRTVTVTVEPYEAEVCRDLTDLNPAFFQRNASTLSAEARKALNDNLEILNTCPNTCVTIAGHADPGERRVDELSTARANAVQTFYVAGGVPASRLSAEGRGRVEGVSRKEAAAQFRRVDSLPHGCTEM